MTVFEYTDRDGETHEIRPSTDWVNHGDVNPRDHGGRFIKWTGSMWAVIETRPPGMLPDGLSTDQHMIEEIAVYPSDMWVGGDPDNGPTDFLQDRIGVMAGYDSYPQAMLETAPEYWVVEYISYHGGSRTDWVEDDDWNDWLDGRGIDP
jgi:hypothetical protein